MEVGFWQTHHPCFFKIPTFSRCFFCRRPLNVYNGCICNQQITHIFQEKISPLIVSTNLQQELVVRVTFPVRMITSSVKERFISNQFIGVRNWKKTMVYLILYGFQSYLDYFFFICLKNGSIIKSKTDRVIECVLVPSISL